MIGPKAHFEFRTLGEVKVQGEVKGRLGFAEGEQILHTLVEAGNLDESLQNDSGPGDARYYYSRE